MLPTESLHCGTVCAQLSLFTRTWWHLGVCGTYTAHGFAALLNSVYGLAYASPIFVAFLACAWVSASRPPVTLCGSVGDWEAYAPQFGARRAFFIFLVIWVRVCFDNKAITFRGYQQDGQEAAQD